MRQFWIMGVLALAGCTSLPEPEALPTAMVTLYCYETLADPECYLTPDLLRTNRLLDVVTVPETALLRFKLAASQL